MLETAGRLLRLLSLLQARRTWSGADLAERLGVNVRTIRRDIDRLRSLGYTVQSGTGTAGGYELEAGANLPPLLLDDDEAVAVAVGLWSAATSSVSGIEETSSRALLKLNQVLPAPLRSRVASLHAATDAVPPNYPSPTVHPDTLAVVAAACRDRECLRFDYRDHDDTSSSRFVEPHRLVTWGRRWYLLAWDLNRDDWRTFRLDRLDPRTTGPGFAQRELPDGDPAAFVSRGVSSITWRYRTKVVVHAPAAQLAERLPASAGVVEPVDESTCVLDTGADTLDTLALYLGMLDADFEITDPPELVDRVRALGARYARAAPTP